jgi:hypothetical protein
VFFLLPIEASPKTHLVFLSCRVSLHPHNLCARSFSHVALQRFLTFPVHAGQFHRRREPCLPFVPYDVLRRTNKRVDVLHWLLLNRRKRTPPSLKLRQRVILSRSIFSLPPLKTMSAATVATKELMRAAQELAFTNARALCGKEPQMRMNWRKLA